MDSSVSAKDEMWFLRVCHQVPHELYRRCSITINQPSKPNQSINQRNQTDQTTLADRLTRPHQQTNQSSKVNQTERNHQSSTHSDRPINQPNNQTLPSGLLRGHRPVLTYFLANFVYHAISRMDDRDVPKH